MKLISVPMSHGLIMIKEHTRHYLEEERQALDSIPLQILEDIVEILYGAYVNGNNIFVFGNGGSASTASHFSCDMNKGVSFGLKNRFRFICLNDNIPTLMAYANDQSYEDIFVEPLKNFLRPDDVVIGISGSGNSENVIKAIQYANEFGAKSVAFVGFNGGRLAKVAKISLIVPVDDIQKVEDAHLIFSHVLMQVFFKKLHLQKS